MWTERTEPAEKGGRLRLLEGRHGGLSLWVGAVLVLALGLRLVRLDFQPLWWDEGWSLYFATSDVRTMLELTAIDIHPPLYYLLLHLWIQLVGSGALAARLLSVGIGVATVALLYSTGRRLWGTTAGLLAATLLAISPFHIYYSQEVRMYGLVTLLGLAAFAFALGEEWIVGRLRWTLWWGYVLTAAGALYTQYFAAFLLLGLNLVVLIRWLRARRPARALVPWLGAQLVTIALYLPWIWYAGSKLAAYVRFKVGVEKDLPLGFLQYIGRHLAAFDWGHAEGALAGWAWLGLLPLVVLALCLVLPARRVRLLPEPTDHSSSSGATFWAAVIVAVVLLSGFVVNRMLPFNPARSERLLLLALPAYLLAITALLLPIVRRRPGLGALAWGSFLVVAVGSLAFFYTVPRYPDDDYRPLIARVRALGLPADVVLCVHPWQVGYMQAYIPDQEARPALVLTPREVLPTERQLWAEDPAEMSADLEALLAQHGRLWLPAHQAMGRLLENQMEAYLVGSAYPVLSEWHGPNTVLSLFAAGQPAGARPVPVTAQFGEWLTLQGAALGPEALEAGWGVVAADLTWQVSAPPSEPYHVGLRLIDAAGRVWAQRDSPPRAGLIPFSEWPVDDPQIDRHGLLVPAGTPPGEYQVALRVYRSEDMAVLPVTFEGGSGGEMRLGTVRVVRPQTPPPVEALDIEQPQAVDWSGRLRLLGSSMSGDAVLRPGQEAELDLFWQALVAPAEDWLPRLQLVDANGDVLAEKTEKPVMGSYPTAWWQAGELVRDPHELPIPARTPPGTYRLTLTLIRAADGQPVGDEHGRKAVDLAGVEVQGRRHQYEPMAPQHVQTVRLGAAVDLAGYDLSATAVAPGEALEVVFYWHVLETPDREYHSFVHLLDANGKIVAQHDGPPGQGTVPTLGWLPGEYLADGHVLTLPAGLPAGQYRLGVGFYDPATGQRLAERLLLDTPVLVKREE